MPIYEYFCEKCKNRFELMRPFALSQEDADCPKCHGTSKRILSRCYTRTGNQHGVANGSSGAGSSCSSCSSGNCGSCGH